MPESSQYIVSARKYRPDSFEDLIGQDNIVRTLKNSIVRGKLAHAYLFCGPRGVGKTSAARIFAKTINCEHPTADMEPCGQCESCVSFREGRSYCIHELDAASNNGVDDIKALMEQVQIPPQIGRYSVFIIDEVHMLSQSAFNAFLKTLEEPPAHAIFILATTEKHKILPTILSRCQTYDFNRISIPDIVRNLRAIATKENINVDDESLHIVARKADGAMRDALTIFDQTVAFCGSDIKYENVIRNLNVLDYEYSFRLTESMLANDYAAALLEFDSILSKGFNALYFVSSLSTHFRNLMVAKSGALDSLLEFPDSLKLKYKEQADRCSLQFIYDALAVTSQCEAGYKESINPRLHIEFALMKLCFLTGGPVSLKQPAPQAVQVAQPTKATATASQPVQAPVSVNAEAQTQPPAQTVQTPQAPQIAQDEAPAAETPAPVVTETAPAESSAPQPAPRRKRASKAASLSLDAIEESTDEKETVAADNRGLSGRIPDDQEIKDAWKKLPPEYKSRPRLYSTLESTGVVVSDKGSYKLLEFFVQNVAQKNWVEQELLRELEGKLQRLTESTGVRLGVQVLPEEKVEKKVYMPEDKAKAMMAANKEIENLVKDFDLDVK